MTASTAPSTEPLPSGGFSSFYEGEWRPSLRFVQRTISDSHLARDIVQEGFLRLHVHWNRVPPHARGAWLRRVLKNLCTDELRRKAQQPTCHRAWEPGRDDDRGAPDAVLTIRPHEHPDELAAQEEQLDALLGFFDQLPPTLWAALEGSMDTAQDHASTAAALGCAVKTVSTRVFRARRYIAGYLSRRRAG